MKRTTIVAIALFSLLLASASGALAQAATPTAQNSNITIINEGNVLSGSDLDSVRSLASNFPLPLLIYITNQYHGAKIDFSRKVAKLVTENNVVIGISTYKDNNENDHYRLIGAGPKAGISSDMLDGAQNAADRFLRAASGPQYALGIDAAIDYIASKLGPANNNAPPTAIATNSGNVNIINEGDVLSGSEIGSIHDLTDNYLSIPALIYVTNQYRGTLDGFKSKAANYITDNNFVVAISTYNDGKSDDRYVVLGSGARSGLAQSDLTDALNASQSDFNSNSSYSGALASVFGTIKGAMSITSSPAAGPLVIASAWRGSLTSSSDASSSNTSSTNSNSTDTSAKGSGSSFWGNIGVILLVLFGLWLAFLFLRWLWRQGHPMPAGQQRPGGATTEGDDYGRGYVGSGPIFYPIWLGGGSYGGDGGSLSLGGGGGAAAPPAPDAGGGSFASAFGGAGGGGSASSNAGGGKFESSLGSSSGGSSSSSGGGGGGFESAANATGATVGGEAAGAMAGAAVNILGGILGAVFSSGSGGSGPDF